ncbi:sulfite exporter TauE/SafE family protein [Candidatus Bathyarchaeota archaeon]|nr:sulfite exporter TauE/SafE family protein [Candidatus Bathyarchaeota archaeon]
MFEWLLPVFGFLIGIAAALTGVGGGIFIVPLLNLLYGFPVIGAIGTSLATIILTSIASTVNYVKQKRVYFKIGLILALATAPGAYAGSELTKVSLIKTWLGPIFGVFLIIVAAQMIFKALSIKSEKRCMQTDPVFETALLRNWNKLLLGLALGFFGGVASGLLGVGGGTILVPIMCYALDFPIHFSIPTSMFIMIFTSITGVTGHLQQGNVNPQFALYLGLGSVLGAQVGAYASKKLSGRNLHLVFAAMLIVASINMMLKSLEII